MTCQSDTATISAPATSIEPASVCGNVMSATLLVSTAPKSVSMARPVDGSTR